MSSPIPYTSLPLEVKSTKDDLSLKHEDAPDAWVERLKTNSFVVTRVDFPHEFEDTPLSKGFVNKCEALPLKGMIRVFPDEPDKTVEVPYAIDLDRYRPDFMCGDNNAQTIDIPFIKKEGVTLRLTVILSLDENGFILGCPKIIKN